MKSCLRNVGLVIDMQPKLDVRRFSLVRAKITTPSLGEIGCAASLLLNPKP